MSSLSLIYSNRKVCARYDGQNRRFRSFTTVDPTTRKACKGSIFMIFEHLCVSRTDYLVSKRFFARRWRKKKLCKIMECSCCGVVRGKKRKDLRGELDRCCAVKRVESKSKSNQLWVFC